MKFVIRYIQENCWNKNKYNPVLVNSKFTLTITIIIRIYIMDKTSIEIFADNGPLFCLTYIQQF